jgi:HlyD family secretion protein
MKKVIIILIVTTVLIGSGYIFMIKDAAEPKFTVLKTEKVERADLQEVIIETGIIKPQVGAQITLGTQATGKLTDMYVEVGDVVSKGQIIAQIDDREIKKTIAQLRSNLNKTKKSLEKENLTYPKRIHEAQQEESALKAEYELTALELTRQKELYEKGFTSRTDLDKTETEFLKAQAQYKKSLTIIERIEEEHKSEKEIIEQEIESISANIEKEQIKLSYTTIYSPLDGVVSEITAQKGETLVAGLQVAQLITIINPDKLEMWIYVDETEIGKIKPQLNVQFTVDTYSDKIFYGKIDRINPQPIIKDNIVYFIAIVVIGQDDAPLLRPEMTTYVKIIVNVKKDVITVANSALKFEEGQQIVYKISSGDTVQKVPITTGIRGEKTTQVLSGVKEGDTVATKLIRNKKE